MNTGILKPLLLALAFAVPLFSPAAHAQLQTVAATFDSGESEPTGVDANLRASRRLNDDGSGSAPVQASAPHAESPSAAPAPSMPPAVATTSAMTSPVSAPLAQSQDRLTVDSQSKWVIRNGERLSDVFMRWARVVGWQTTWEPTDLVALADLQLDDTFTGAITKVVEALNRGGEDVQAKFYATNHMLRITARK